MMLVADRIVPSATAFDRALESLREETKAHLATHPEMSEGDHAPADFAQIAKLGSESREVRKTVALFSTMLAGAISDPEMFVEIAATLFTLGLTAGTRAVTEDAETVPVLG